jgi:hypothetical protein
VVGAVPPPDQPRYSASESDGVSSPVVEPFETGPPASAQAVERLVGEPVGVRVALAGHPGEDRAGRCQPAGLHGQRLHVGVLDLPRARHLLDHEPGVHPHFERGAGCVLAVELQPGDQAAVLRDVVGGDADRLAPLGDGLAGGGVLEHGAVRRRAGVAAGATVGLDPDGGRGAHAGAPAESGA